MKDSNVISETNLEKVAGGSGDDEGIKIIVDYVIWGTTDHTKERYQMTYYVEMNETIESIETRTWKRAMANGGTCETFYNGTLVPKTTTIRELGIQPYETLTMTVEAFGGGW